MFLFQYRFYLGLLLFSQLLFSSCRKFTEVPDPHNLILGDDVFSSDATANSAVAGLYAQFMRPQLYMANAGLSIYPALSADELYNTAPDPEFDPITANDIPANLGGPSFYFWSPGFQAIYQCNAILEGLDKATALSASIKQQLRGEALFVRAFVYFYLVNIFGDVPLPLSTDYHINARLPRKPSEAVYEQILADLQTAIKDLPSQPIGTGRARPNKWAAQAFLARVYLYLHRWQDAVDASTAVIERDDFALVAALENVFLMGSKETIWQLQPIGNITYTTQGQLFIPLNASTSPTFNATASLWQSFETGDNRAQTWLKTATVGAQTYHYPYKYKQRGGAIVTENNIVFRLAEQYLIRAEAHAMLNQPELALEDLNRIHVRAGLPPLSSLTGQSLSLAIEKERFLELFTEWGHRWFDLKRTKRSDVVLAPLKGAAWQSSDTLYPIPQEELRLNSNLHQNPGY